MRASRLRLLGFALTWLVVATGCATPRIVSQWSSPEYAAPRFEKIMVIGITRQPSIRRSFEDEFVARLKATGVDAVPSYRFIPEDGPVEEARLTEAVKQAGAGATTTARPGKGGKKTPGSPAAHPPRPRGFGASPGPTLGC